MIGFCFGVFLCIAIQFILVITYVLLNKPKKSRKIIVDDDVLTQMDATASVSETGRSGRMIDKLSNSLESLFCHSERESCVWLNAFISRLYAQSFNTGYVDQRLTEKLYIELEEFTESSIGRILGFKDLMVTSMQTPLFPPIIKTISTHRKVNEHSNFFALLDVKFEGKLIAFIKGTCLFQHQINIRCELDNFYAKVFARYHRSEKLLAYSFLELPSQLSKIDIEIDGFKVRPFFITILKQLIIPFLLWKKLHPRLGFVKFTKRKKDGTPVLSPETDGTGAEQDVQK